MLHFLGFIGIVEFADFVVKKIIIAIGNPRSRAANHGVATDSRFYLHLHAAEVFGIFDIEILVEAKNIRAVGSEHVKRFGSHRCKGVNLALFHLINIKFGKQTLVVV